MKAAKKSPLCGSSDLRFVFYSIPMIYAPDLWEWDEDGCSPLILNKRIECKKCGATVPHLCITLDQAIDMWNAQNDEGSRYVLQKTGTEQVRNVEGDQE